MLNAGISGNRVLGDGAGISALARFDKDVLMQTGVTYVVVLEGINDIGVARSNATPSAADLIAGHSSSSSVRMRAGSRLRRDAHAVRGRGLFHAGGGGEAPGAQRVDPHGPRLRRRDRLRQSRSRSGGADEVRAGLRFRRPPAPGRRRLHGDGRRGRPRVVPLEENLMHAIPTMSHYAARNEPSSR